MCDAAGRYSEAEQLPRQVLVAQQRVLGPEHPDTLTSQHYLANTLRDQGKLQVEKLAATAVCCYMLLLRSLRWCWS